MVQEVFERPMAMDPWTYLLSRPHALLSSAENSLLTKLTLAVRLSLAQFWKQPDLPPPALVSLKIKEARVLDELTATLRNSSHTYDKIWSPWIHCAAQFEA